MTGKLRRRVLGIDQLEVAMIIRKISRTALEDSPYEAWNAFIDLLAREKYGDLDGVQRVAQLCFWYDSEVQNGGHLQYFENRGAALLDDTLAALASLGASCQGRVLERASRLFLSAPRDRTQTVEEHVATAREKEFAAVDSAYYRCEPAVEQLLREYFENNKAHFVRTIDGERE